MKAVAKVKNVRYGVRKLRMVADLMRGKSVDEAIAILSILRSRKKGAVIVENALKSAIANFKQKSPSAVATRQSYARAWTRPVTPRPLHAPGRRARGHRVP